MNLIPEVPHSLSMDSKNRISQAKKKKLIHANLICILHVRTAIRGILFVLSWKHSADHEARSSVTCPSAMRMKRKRATPSKTESHKSHLFSLHQKKYPHDHAAEI